MPLTQSLDRGLTDYGDRDFARFLRRSFARSMGISTDLLSRPVVGIAMTPWGSIKLGPDHAEPQYSVPAWFAAGASPPPRKV